MSTVILFKTDITPQMNARVDDIEDYLTELKTISSNYKQYDNYQFIKHELDITIKVPLTQDYASTIQYNYVVITNTDDIHPWYYFIIDSKWLGKETVQLTLSLDSINTIWDHLEDKWTNKTLITRQHKDRFVQQAKPESTDTSYTLYRKVDKRSEGLGLDKTLRLSKPQPIEYSTIVALNKKWYLVYQSDNVDENAPIRCYLYPETDSHCRFTQGESTYIVEPADVPYGHKLVARYEASTNTGSVYLNGIQYTLSNIDGDGYANKIEFSRTPQEGRDIANNYYVDLYNTNGEIFLSYEIGTNCTVDGLWNNLTEMNARGDILRDHISFPIGVGYATIKGIDSLNKTLPTLVKIIALPYPPVDITWNGTHYHIDETKVKLNVSGLLEFINTNIEFETELTDTKLSQTNELKITLDQSEIADLIGLNTENDKKFESKLYHSDFYTKTYFYDTYRKDILLEQWNTQTRTDNHLKFKVVYKQSNNISSRMLFHFSSYYYNELVDYGEYLNINRNNEVNIYTNNYLNYMRNGYNYDKKKIALEQGKNWTQFGISSLATVGSLLASSVTGGLSITTAISSGTSTVNSLTNILFNKTQAERDLAQKINELKDSPSSVAGADDLDLLNYYNGNSLQVSSYTLSEDIQNATYNLLRLTGYADNTYGIPEFHTRIWYNFLQCEPVFDAKGIYYDSIILDDFKARCKVGITIFHHLDDNWDFAQDMENFETWLLH